MRHIGGDFRWPAPYAIRRVAGHMLDHAWEIEDKSQADLRASGLANGYLLERVARLLGGVVVHRQCGPIIPRHEEGGVLYLAVLQAETANRISSPRDASHHE
jgi:hypothetical protein